MLRIVVLSWMLFIALLEIVPYCSAQATNSEIEEIIQDLKTYDTNLDNFLDEVEIRNYFIAKNQEDFDNAAEDFVDDMLSHRCDDCQRVSIENAAEFVASTPSGAPSPRFGWPTLGFARYVIDTADPRPSKTKVPYLVMFKRDNESEKKNQLTLLGGIQLYTFGLDLDEQKENDPVVFTFGIETDIEGSRDADDNTVQVGALIDYLTFLGNPDANNYLSLLVAPKYITDGDFDRKVYEGRFVIAFSSGDLGMGYLKPRRIDAPVKFLWQPSFQLEYGHVDDPGGNATLAEIKTRDGDYFRYGPRVQVSIFPNRLSERLRFGFEYIHRFDSEQESSRPYVEIRSEYDILADGRVQFSAIYRLGRKPPDFKKLNSFLIGIGLLQ